MQEPLHVNVKIFGESGNQRFDETIHLYGARYGYALKALWRLYGFDAVDRSLPVVSLDEDL